MLKVQKKIQNSKSQNNDELTDLQNQIKNSIKNLFIKDQKNKKTINGYADLITKIRNEYAQLQKQNNQLKTELQKYQQYVQNVSQNPYIKPSYVRPKRKRMQYYDESDESDESDSYISEVRKRPRKSQKIYIYMKMILMGFHRSRILQLRKKIKKMIFTKFKIINQKRNNQNKSPPPKKKYIKIKKA